MSVDYTNMEEAWDHCCRGRQKDDPERRLESVFYAGASAMLALQRKGRSPSDLRSEIIDWFVCFLEGTHGTH